jgi:hypothetical protein
MTNKNILDIREQALEKIKSLQKLEPDFVMSWLGGLTDLEQKILSVVYIYNKALTIKDIMNFLVKNTLSVLTSRDYPPNIEYLREFDFPFSSYYVIDKEVMKKLYPEVDKKSKNLQILKKEFKFPSFRRVDKSIQDLISMGVVLVREGELKNEKIKGLYYLNPIIRSQLNKLKENMNFNIVHSVKILR